MTTHEDDVIEEAPPSWVLRTPTRRREVWPLPALAAALAVVLVVIPVWLGGPVSIVVGVLSGVPVGVGAVMLAVAGRTAYREQSRAASWRFHVVGTVLGFGAATILALAGLVRGHFIGVGSGGVFMAWQVFQFARSVPRLDRLVAAVCATALAAGAVTLAVLGVVLPDVPEARQAVWIGPGTLVAVLAAVVAVVQFRAARTAPLE
ncbi:hypothetical protein ITJ54_07395 [Curtobacterium sp. VKM Ac-2865]|uniref:hypothetical protein n=1 Tax=Curtobacterium sp. VKM Ac-2865 TaxID=2783817 RepID=UPI00188B3DA7|nr:hypothetical protein [Curtobacterium sp. VKM Ac-2865]MBF4582492.1 hypothetical protein [Curtobacterium sp. VKM Ac-2865]